MCRGRTGGHGVRPGRPLLLHRLRRRRRDARPARPRLVVLRRPGRDDRRPRAPLARDEAGARPPDAPAERRIPRLGLRVRRPDGREQRHARTELRVAAGRRGPLRRGRKAPPHRGRARLRRRQRCASDALSVGRGRGHLRARDRRSRRGGRRDRPAGSLRSSAARRVRGRRRSGRSSEAPPRT